MSGRIGLTLAALALAAPLAAPAQQPLRLREAVASALATHPSLGIAGAAARGAEAAAEEARAARLPSLSLDASATRFEEPMVVAPLHGFDPTAPPRFDETLLQGSVSAAYTLFDGGARAAGVGRAEALVAAAGAGEEAARVSLTADAARAFLRVLAAREVATAHAGRVEAVEGERRRAGRMFEEGRSARVALLRAEAALGAARADLAGARVEAEVAERELARLMGVEPARVASAALRDVAPAAPAVSDRRALVERALAGSPEVERLRARVLAARQGIAQARSLLLPRLQLGGRYLKYAYAGGIEAGEWQGGLQLSYPLFTGGARGAAADRAGAELSAAESELALAELTLAGAVDRALAALESARARADALRAAVEQAEEVVRIERLALDEGAGVQSDLLDAVAELLRVRAALAEARYAEVGARVELARITGELSVRWLAENLEDAS